MQIYTLTIFLKLCLALLLQFAFLYIVGKRENWGPSQRHDGQPWLKLNVIWKEIHNSTKILLYYYTTNIIKLTSRGIDLSRSDAKGMLEPFFCFWGPKVEYFCCLCTFVCFSWRGVDGGVEEGVLLSDDEVSDGNVAKVQYEPSDSPSLTNLKKKVILEIEK